LVARYLRHFVFITKHGTYIDGFAGPQEVDKPEMWAAKLVLESEPRWLQHFFLCDASRVQIRRLEDLYSGQSPRKRSEPVRDVRILAGDFNETVVDILATGVIDEREAAFALLDQRTFECKWETVSKLASHKKTGTKIELFYFLPIKWLYRAISGMKDKEKGLDDWWGRSDWRHLASSSPYSIQAAMVRRFQKELGYSYVTPWAIHAHASGGAIMYYMIHATDHFEAPKLMARAYRNATTEPEAFDQLQFDLERDGIDVKAMRKGD
jgi:three-Cys-motif partner protein